MIGLADSSKKIIRAHASDLRQIDLSSDGEIIATASKQGTLIRLFSTTTLAQTHEFRRGVDAAIIYSLVISPRGHFVACSSDKGTIHIFDLRSQVREEAKPLPTSQKRSSVSRVSSIARRPASTDVDTHSLPSQSSNPPVSYTHLTLPTKRIV